MTNEVMKIPFDSPLFNLTEINPSFDAGVLRIAYHGKNRNKSNISKEAFERCITTAYNVPIVANYNRGIDDIGSHDIELVEKDGALKIVHITQPVGVVPQGAKWHWETVEDDSGTHEYICIEVLIWKRQECYEKIKENGFTKHSMEISVVDGEMTEGYYNIYDFFFTALTLLGDGVEPCFESSGLQLFNLDECKDEMRKMMDDFKREFSKITDKEDKEMDEKLNLIQSYQLNPEELDFEFDNLSIDELKEKLEQIKADKEFKLNLNDYLDEIHAQLEEVKYIDRWGYECSKYWFIDLQDDEVIVCNCEDRYRAYGIPVEESGDKITLNFAKCKRKKVKYEDYIDGESEDNAYFEKIVEESMNHAVADKDAATQTANKMTEKYNAVQVQYDDIESKYNELVEAENQRQYEADKAAKEAVFEQFEKELGNIKEYQELKDTADNLDVSAIEEKCYAMFGKFKANFSKQNNKKSAVIVGSTVSPKVKAYGDLFDFLNK